MLVGEETNVFRILTCHTNSVAQEDCKGNLSQSIVIVIMLLLIWWYVLFDRVVK